MADPFPDIVPTTRSFTMGDYPSRTYRSLAGTVFKRSFGNKQTGFRIDLTFKNIGDSDSSDQESGTKGTGEFRDYSGTAKQILDHYRNVYGTLQTFYLPDFVFRGMDDNLELRIQDPREKGATAPSISWRYAEPPKVQSVKANVSTVTVKLIGELDS